MNKTKRIKQLELENFNLKNRMKALEQRLFILEAKQSTSYIPFYVPPQYIPTYDDNSTGKQVPEYPYKIVCTDGNVDEMIENILDDRKEDWQELASL